MKTLNKDKMKSTSVAVGGKMKLLMKKTVRFISIVFLAGFAMKGIDALWVGKPNIGSILAWLVIGLLLYAHYL